jgi:hypothetical protein
MARLAACISEKRNPDIFRKGAGQEFANAARRANQLAEKHKKDCSAALSYPSPKAQRSPNAATNSWKRAYLEVQRMIDRGGTPSPVISVDILAWTHRNFCERLPEELLVVVSPTTHAKLKVAPGDSADLLLPPPKKAPASRPA